MTQREFVAKAHSTATAWKTQENLELAVQQRIGIAQASSEVVGAEVKRIVASPFYRKVLSIQLDC